MTLASERGGKGKQWKKWKQWKQSETLGLLASQKGLALSSARAGTVSKVAAITRFYIELRYKML